MEYSCQTYELKCNECGRRFGNRPLSGCPDCLAPLEIHYDLDAIKRALAPRLRPSTSLVFLRADVCREDLLVEIEATGESRQPS